MYPVSAKQIKAARALLDWSQEDLAEASRLSISTIRTMELGKIPRISTMRDICTTIEHSGLEFTEGEGVRRRDLDVLLLKGETSCDDLFEDVRKVTQKSEGDVLVFTKTENILTMKTGAKARTNLDRLEEVHKTTGVKCLLTAAERPSFAKPSFACRIIPSFSCGSAFCLVYGGKYAHIMQEGPASLMVVTFNIASVAYSERKDFMSLWGNAFPVNF